VAVPDGYADLEWFHFSILNAEDIPAAAPWPAALVSPKNVAFNSHGMRARLSSPDKAFDLDSAFLTDLAHNGLRVRAQGFLGNTLKFDNIYNLDPAHPTLINFGYTNITRVTFIPLGEDSRIVSGAGGFFALDNMTIVFVPEPGPASLSLLVQSSPATDSVDARRGTGERHYSGS